MVSMHITFYSQRQLSKHAAALKADELKDIRQYLTKVDFQLDPGTGRQDAHREEGLKLTSR